MLRRLRYQYQKKIRRVTPNKKVFVPLTSLIHELTEARKIKLQRMREAFLRPCLARSLRRPPRTERFTRGTLSVWTLWCLADQFLNSHGSSMDTQFTMMIITRSVLCLAVLKETTGN